MRRLALLALLAAPLVVAPRASAAPPAAGDAADRAAILAGVGTVGRPGLPGVVTVFGEDAFAVLTGGRDRPEAVVGGARAGKGRVVAFAHDGYLSAPFLAKDGTWGPFHELGHNRQRPWWTFDGTVEVTNNLFALQSHEKLCGIRPWDHPWLAGQKAAAARYLQAPDFAKWKQSPGVALTTFAFVEREFGWAPFRRVFAEMEVLPDAERPKSDAAKIDAWAVRLSKACGRDLRPYLRKWAWPLSDAALRDADVGRLPPWDPDLADVGR